MSTASRTRLPGGVRAPRRRTRITAAALTAALAGALPVVTSPAAGAAPAPVGYWASHGRTLELRPDGSGALSSWVGALDGTRLHLQALPLPGPAAVAGVTAVETVGAGGLGPAELPGLGGLVTVDTSVVAPAVRVEWTSGARRLGADLCPVTGLMVRQMEEMHCGA